MPELYSRMDDAGWLTPSIADILEQGAPPPGGDGSIRDYMLTIQRELADLETPAKIVNVRSMPSYTLYVARPETVGRLGNRRSVTSQEVRKSLARIAEQHTDWSLGFIPRLQEDETTLGILLRTNAHKPLSLRRLLVRGNFRTSSAYHTYTLGITLEQNLVVRDLATTRHLLVIGADNAKIHFLRAMLLTLIVLNTPSELRVILAGSGVENLKAVIASPHSLGRTVNQGEALLKILEGLKQEVKRREMSFAEYGVDNLDAFNVAARERNKSTLPRILVVLDSVADTEWNDVRSDMNTAILSLIKSTQELGVHFVIALPDMERQKQLQQAITTHVIMRSSAKSLSDQIPDFHPSLLRFVDAIVSDTIGDRVNLTPVELCSTTNNELIAVIAYWQQNRQLRQQELQGDKPVSGRTGVTDLLSFPEPPDSDLTQTEQLPDYTSAAAPTVTHEVSVPTPISPQPQLILEEPPSITDVSPLTNHAVALAAYLGWLSAGALVDIFGIAPDYAGELIEQLKRDGLLENLSNQTPRFLRR